MSNRVCNCNFCGKSGNEVRLIAGPTAFICRECVDLCVTILDENSGPGSARTALGADGRPARKPREIKAMLDEHCIGQDAVKKRLAVAVYQHYARTYLRRTRPDGVAVDKSNILLIGPSGTGKTLLARTLAALLDVPFVIVDATNLTQAGYVGEDVESILARLLAAAGGDVERARRGIVYIDEIDKICRKSENPSLVRDVSGEGVQHALLKIIEGTVAFVPKNGGRKHPHEETIAVDTTDILFICGGAFVGLDAVVERRTGQRTLGFGASPLERKRRETTQLLALVEPADLVAVGLIPEFVGRLPVVATLEELDEDALVAILVEPRNAITRQYRELFALDGVALEFEPDALRAIARAALSRKSGARGLRAVLETVMLEASYSTPSELGEGRMVVTQALVESTMQPAAEAV